MLVIGADDTEQADAGQDDAEQDDDTEQEDGAVQQGDRVAAVHGPMGMAWCSELRINAYLPGYDFTNKIDMLTLPEPGWTDPLEKFLDLDQGYFVYVDYVEDLFYGIFHVVRTLRWEGDLRLEGRSFAIAMVHGPDGHRLLRAVRKLQRAVLCRLALRRVRRVSKCSRHVLDIAALRSMLRGFLC